VGSPEYIAIEVLDESVKHFDLRADWWSIGCILFELLTGMTPFYADTVAAIFDNIRNWQSVMQSNQELMDQLQQAGEDAVMSEAAWDLIQGYGALRYNAPQSAMH
jgi:serine/threonine protein kinase